MPGGRGFRRGDGADAASLHKAGLLSPGDRSPAGHRLCSDADLVRLQQILFHRELGFSLEEIATVFENPRADALEHLRARHTSADGDDLLTNGDVPHALLFPRPAAVVHHAGAGTSAAALRAAVSAVPVPVTADQPFWARRLAALGAATEPVPFRALTAERLADALDRVVRQRTYARAAAAAAHHIATGDGAGHVLKAVQQSAHG
ncbi:nucleotide disphospho-sugar-binding domain-containing protein [Streptomyces minutiscleroticus]|uniref:MerR family transcriptional regulator n=1 Tax=Streptomyces minutiscleroticus TaxID=68238 RepID=UPI003D9FA872